MSAFVVEDKTINRIVGFLAKTDSCRLILEETGCNLATREGCQQLAVAMYALNCNAVDQRYGPGESASFRDNPVFQYTPLIGLVTPIQAYKSLQCWHYQCAEGDVPDSSLLYATMRKVAGELAESIIYKLAAFDKAEWA